MYHNTWGGPLEIAESVEDDDRSRNLDLDRASLQRLDETQQSWLLGAREKKKSNYIDLGCITCSKKLFKGFAFTFSVVALIILITVLGVKLAPRHHHYPPPPDNYTLALHKALLFFNAQKSGVLPRSNNISYRGNSGLKDGSAASVNLVGGYYDAGDNIKFHFPQAFTMTLLSWSVIEYSAKYEAAGELDHVKDIIKWGTDYLLKTFNSTIPFNASAPTKLDYIYAQVGQGGPGGKGGQGVASTTPNDHYCWERPEDMDYPRPVARISTGSDLAAEMAAALAAASIVFKDNAAYSRKLVNGARGLFQLSRDRRGRYSASVPDAALFYNSTGYYDEFLWGGAWLYYATGNTSYLQLVTTLGIGKWAGAYGGGPFYGVFDWDNKLIGAQMLLTRLRLLQYPGYPYDEVLKNFNNQTNIVMCSFLPVYMRFLRTPGGLSVFNRGYPAPLQYAVNSAFIATLYADYLAAGDIPGWYCGPTFYLAETLRQFARSQMDYILGKNPLKMSYVVGFGNKYPRYVHHRAASIPKNGHRYGCTDGWRWRDSKSPNPNTIVGAMVGGPNLRDHFQDSRTNYNFTEPTIAGNAGLVAALVALSGNNKTGIDAATIFSQIPPMFPSPPPPAAPWVP